LIAKHRSAALISKKVAITAASVALAFAAMVGMSRGASAKKTILGTALSPAHFPYFSDADIDTFFDQAALIGNHVTWIVEWESLPPFPYFKVVQEKCAQRGLKFHLSLSPIALMGGRKTPAIPAKIGGTSFSDPKVRAAYIDEVLRLASLKPDYIGLATEVNFLAQNPPEFDAFVSLAHDAYAAVRQKYPSQQVTISFQWDVMRAQHQSAILERFAHSLDVYSFTSYPDAFGDPSKVKVPSDYFSSVRRFLPTQRVGFSEVGWSSAPPSSEDDQAAFFRRLPEFTNDAHFEYVTLALLHDVSMFTGDLQRLNYVGIRRVDDAPKKSWDALLNMGELR
jgi:hypothetical protein